MAIVAGVRFGVRVPEETFASSQEESMQKLSTAWLLWAALACGSCDNGTTADYTPPDPFVGRWSCNETRTLTFTSPAGSPDATSQTSFILNTAVTDGEVAMYATSEAGASCRLNFTETEGGTSAMLMTGQSCTTGDGIMLSYQMGTADIGATGLQTNLAFGFTETLQDDAGSSLDAAGMGTTSSLCSRIYAPVGGGSPGGGGW
jgi:hypothetical protein